MYHSVHHICMCVCVCRVLGDLLNCEKETMSSHDDEELKNSLHLGTLSLLATTWQHYGHRSEKAPRYEAIPRLLELGKNPHNRN